MKPIADVLPPGVGRAILTEAVRAARRLRRHGYDVEDIFQQLVVHWLVYRFIKT